MFARGLQGLVNGVALAAAAIFFTQPVSAQTRRRWEFAPVFGAYLPAERIPAQGLNITCLKSISEPCEPIRGQTQNLSIALGGRVTAWLSNRRAIEGAFWYAPSGVSGPYFGASAEIVAAELRFALNVAPQAKAMSVLVTGGPAVIHRFGDYYTELRGRTSPGAVLGIGLDFHPGQRFGFRAQIQDYVYNLHLAEQFTQGGQGYQVGTPNLQNDFVLSVSLSPFGREHR